MRTVHELFKQADEKLIAVVNSKQAELGRLFGKVLADATQLLAQFCTQTAGLIKAGSVPPAAAGGGGGAERKIQIMRTPVRRPLAAPAPRTLRRLVRRRGLGRRGKAWVSS